MELIATIVLPIFGIIGVGYLVAWSGALPTGSNDAISDFVLAVPIPVLLFRAIADAEISSSADPTLLWIVYFAGLIIIWTASTFLICRVFSRDAKTGIIGAVAAAYGNAFMLGIPLVVTAYGNEAAGPISLIVSMQMFLLGLGAAMVAGPLMDNGVAAAVAKAYRFSTIVNITKHVVRNPIMLGVIAGLVWRFSGLTAPGPVEEIVNRIADIAGTLLLLSIGLGLRQYGFGGDSVLAITLTFFKLMVLPAITFVIVFFLVPLPPIWAKVAIIAAACPSGSAAYVVASRYRIGEGLASSTIVLTTVLSIFSITFWLEIAERWL